MKYYALPVGNGFAIRNEKHECIGRFEFSNDLASRSLTEELVQQFNVNQELVEALENIVMHQKMIAGPLSQLSATSVIATKALNKVK